MKRPDKNSSIQEIKAYRPQCLGDAWSWFYKRKELLKRKRMEKKWKSWSKSSADLS